MTTGENIGRRTVLAGIGGLATATMAGCTTEPGTGPQPDPSPDAAATLELPTFQSAQSVQPDLAGTGDGVPDAYFSYPEEPQPFVTEAPGTGTVVTGMFGLTTPAPGPLDRNPWWQELNTLTNATWEFNLTPNSDYSGKLSTTLTGDDLPDLVQVPDLPRLPDLLEAKFEDLTPHLAGDAILDYPALANLPTPSWRTTVSKGRIYAVPPANLIGSPTWLANTQLFDAAGVSFAPGSIDDLVEASRAVTDAAKNVYAFAEFNVVVTLAGAVFDAPNNWMRDDAGGFSFMWESDEYRKCLELGAQLWSEGVIHPDIFGGVNVDESFLAGKLALKSHGGVGYRTFVGKPGITLEFFNPPADNPTGVATKRLGSGSYRRCCIAKQDSPDRVRELLRLLNWFASPFGSSEHLFRLFGSRDVHHTWDAEAKAPVATDRLGPDRVTVGYFASAPYELFDPGHSNISEAMHAHQVDTITTGRADDSVGLYSETYSSQWASITAPVGDVQTAIVRGDRPIGDWDAAVTEWRDAGGGKIGEEFAQAWDATNA